MVRRRDEQIVKHQCIRGGKGEPELRQLLNGSDEMNGKGKLFNVVTVEPGQSIGYHRHEGDSEVYYILSGKPTYNDNGTIVELLPGDTTLCRDGECHGMENNTAEAVVAIALILNA